MADKKIGQVSVEVVPDFDEFHDKAQAGADKEEKRLEPIELEVDANLNADELPAQAKAAKEAAQKAIGEITLRVNLDERGDLQRAIQQIDREISNLGAVKLPVELDEPSLKAARELLQQELEKVGEIGLKVNLDDESSLKRAIAKIDTELSNLKSIELPVNLSESDLLAAKALLNEQLGKIEVPIEPKVEPASAAEAETVLNAISRNRDSRINVDFGKAGLAGLDVISVLSGWDALEKNIIQVHKEFVTLFTELPQIAAGAVGVVTLTGALLNAASGAAALVQNLGQALPVLFAIPGIAIGLGLTAVAFADLGKVLPGVVTQFKALGPLVSGAFWANAAGPISELANGLFPTLAASVKQTGAALGGFFGVLAAQIANVVTGDVLGGWFAQLSLSISTFTLSLGSVASIFKQFGDVGAAVLQPLALLAGELVTRFDEWFKGLVAGAGGVQAFAEGAVSALSGIINFLTAVGGLITSVLSVASKDGAGAFQSLADTINTVATAISSGPLKQVLTDLFASAGQSIALLSQSLGPTLIALLTTVASTLTAVLPSIAGALAIVSNSLTTLFSDPQIQAGLTAFLLGVSNGVAQLAPLFAPIGAIIGELGPVLGTLANTIGTVFASLAPTISGLISALGPLITLLGTTLSQALIAISPLITTIGGAIASLLTAIVPALAPVMAVLVQLISAIMPPLMALVTSLIGPLSAIITALLPPLAAIIGAIAPVLAQLVGVVLAALAPILLAIAPILGQIAILFGQLLTAILPIISVFAELITALLPPLVTILQLLLSAAMVPLQAMIGVLVVVLQVLGDILKWVVEQVIIPIIIPIITFLVNLLASTLIPIFTAVGEFFKATWDLCAAVFAAFKKLFSGDVKGFVTDIQQAFSDFRGKIIDILKNAWDAIWNAAKDAFQNVARAAGEAIIAVIDFFKSLPDKVKANLSNMGTVLIGIGKELIEGLINGIKAKFEEVKNLLSTLTNLLPDWKGPASKDKTLLYDNGQLVIDGFLNGMESRYAMVKRSLAGFTNGIGDTSITSPTGSVNLSAVGSVVGGGTTSGSGNTIIYNAAAGSSLNAEDDLFTALDRARAFGW